MVKDIVKLWKSDDRMIEAEQDLEAVKKEGEELKIKLSEIENGDWWEKEVRNTLKMARENEEVVIVPEGLVASSSYKTIETVLDSGSEDQANYQKWLDLFVY